MKLRRKGFTLVELLAVIVILAVIAVIAVPQVLKIIEGARQDAFKANVKSVIDTATQGLATGKYNPDTTYQLAATDSTALDISNNLFKGGTWHYDSVTKKIYIYSAKDNPDVTQSKYVISGSADEIKNNTAILYKPSSNSNNLLANKIKAALPACVGSAVTTACKVGSGTEKGYVRGPQTGVNNYVTFANKTWRVVKVNDDGSILMTTDGVLKDGSNNQISQPYDGSYATCYTNNQWNGTCSNNFATASIKTYLNTTFYNTLTANEKNMIISNIWDTRLTVNGSTYTGTPSTTIAKVGLLTYYDYITGTLSTGSTYLNNGASYWLGTGSGFYAEGVWTVNSSGSSCINGVSAGGGGVRPAIVLNSGITITSSSNGNGTLATPYAIE